jgi:hypothetical protein
MNTTVVVLGQQKTRWIAAAIAVVAAVLLPQIFHLVGVISGRGVLLGTAFLPMHLPVLLVALLVGPSLGVLVGAFGPIISFLISGMPTASMLPIMVVELAAYGLVGGALAEKRLPVFVKLLLAQISGRLIRVAIALLVAHFYKDIGVVSFTDLVLAPLPGILLQWALIPLLVYRIEGVRV